MGQANARRWTDEIATILTEGDPIAASDLVTTEAPLSEAVECYRTFRDKKPGVVKVVLHP